MMPLELSRQTSQMSFLLDSFGEYFLTDSSKTAQQQ